MVNHPNYSGRTISAVYESGVFKPLKPIKLNTHQRIRLIIETEEDSFPSLYLTPEEILALADKRAEGLRKKPRQVIVKQHRELINALQTEVISKGIKVNAHFDILDGRY